MQLQAGDYILSARPEADLLLSRPDVPPLLSDAAFKAENAAGGELRLGDPAHGAETHALGGLILCDPANEDLLLGLLPRIVHVRAADAAGARLQNLVALVREEAAALQPGRDAMLSRLIELLLIETLRREAPALAPHAGLLAALADPHLSKALTSIHADIGRGWTIDDLARRSGLSRSVFARRFTRTLGAAPVEYLLRWRMALAKDALRHGRGPLEAIAAETGYRSASAFSTAFSRLVGCPPRDYAARLSRPT